MAIVPHHYSTKLTGSQTLLQPSAPKRRRGYGRRLASFISSSKYGGFIAACAPLYDNNDDNHNCTFDLSRPETNPQPKLTTLALTSWCRRRHPSSSSSYPPAPTNDDDAINTTTITTSREDSDTSFKVRGVVFKFRFASSFFLTI